MHAAVAIYNDNPSSNSCLINKDEKNYICYVIVMSFEQTTANLKVWIFKKIMGLIFLTVKSIRFYYI